MTDKLYIHFCKFNKSCRDISEMFELTNLVFSDSKSRERFEVLKAKYDRVCSLGLQLRKGILSCSLRDEYLQNSQNNGGNSVRVA